MWACFCPPLLERNHQQWRLGENKGTAAFIDCSVRSSKLDVIDVFLVNMNLYQPIEFQLYNLNSFVCHGLDFFIFVCDHGHISECPEQCSFFSDSATVLIELWRILLESWWGKCELISEHWSHVSQALFIWFFLVCFSCMLAVAVFPFIFSPHGDGRDGQKNWGWRVELRSLPAKTKC